MGLAPILLLGLLAGLAAQGCAVVDQESYVAGDTGTTTFSNPSSEGVHLGGCSIYGFEKREPDGSTGPPRERREQQSSRTGERLRST